MAALPEERLRFITVVCGVAVIALGVSGLIGGFTRFVTVSSIFHGFVPMALSTALVFVAFGAFLVCSPSGSTMIDTLFISRAVVFCITALVSLEIVDYLFQADIGVLDIAGRYVQNKLSIAYQSMSPVTSVLMTLSGAALLLARSAPEQARGMHSRSNAAGGLGAAVMVAGLILSIAYLYGTPLFYGSRVTPVAATTSAAFLFLGLGIVCMAGPKALPQRYFMGPSIQAKLFRAFIPPTVFLSLASPILNTLILRFIPASTPLMAGIWVVIYAGVTAVVVMVMGKLLGREMEQADAVRRQAEHNLEKAQSYITNILDSMPSMLVGVDPQGVVTHWNKTAESVAGIPAQEAQGQPLGTVFPRLLSHLEDVQTAVRERKLVRTEREMFQKDNEHGYQDVIIYPLICNGVEGAVVRVDDVTQRVHIEEMMVQSEKMMSLGGLAAGMAHEINNPLSVILQGAQMVLAHLSPDVEANRATAEACGCSMEALRAYAEKRKIIKFLDGIREAGLRAARIVSNMLEFSRKSESQRSATTINTILDKSVELALSDYDLKKKYDFKQIHIARDYAPDLPDIPCTRTEIEQVILNLLRNAAQAMAKQTDRGAPPAITLRTSLEKDAIRIDVEDNGPGMSEAVRKRVFEPFFTTKEVGEGTGLGLSVSYFIIVTSHKGRIAVQSEPGKGTRFTLALPLE